MIPGFFWTSGINKKLNIASQKLMLADENGREQRGRIGLGEGPSLQQ